YWILTDIHEIQYLDGKRVTLCQCDWCDVHRIGRGFKVDKHGYVSVNSLCSLRTKEPFVLMSQAQQFFYVSDGLDPNWLVIVETHPRHHYNVAEKEVIEDDQDALQQFQPRITENALISQTNLQETVEV
ncbi:Methionine--tRNA ligase, partial [Bienertia sinuspersici]